VPFDIVVTNTGDDPTGRAVTASDNASVDVIGPGNTVTKTGPAKPVIPGQDAIFIGVAKNTGDVTLKGVTLNDPIAPKCSIVIGTPAPGESSKPVTATSHDPNGKPVTATGDPSAEVAKPAIDLQKKADPTIRPGGTVTFTLVVRNTGNVDLVDVDVTDPAHLACARKFPPPASRNGQGRRPAMVRCATRRPPPACPTPSSRKTGAGQRIRRRPRARSAGSPWSGARAGAVAEYRLRPGSRELDGIVAAGVRCAAVARRPKAASRLTEIFPEIVCSPQCEE
jgi:hypothetical protein